MLRIILLLSLISPAIWAAEVIQVKGTRALIQISPGEFKPGDEAFSIDAGGKRRGLIRVRNIRGDKAVADVVRGTVSVGNSLQVRLKPVSAPPPMDAAMMDEAEPSDTEPATRSRPPFGFMKRGKSAMGLMLGITQYQMSLKASNTVISEDLSLAGSSYSLLGYVDLHSSKSLTWRGCVGLQSLDSKGSTRTAEFCMGSRSCGISIMYLTFEGWGQFNVYQTRSKTRFWIGGGGEFMVTVNKKHNVAALQSIDGTSYYLYASAGGEIALDQTSAIPFSIDMGLQPLTSSPVKTSLMIMRAGYTWRY